MCCNNNRRMLDERGIEKNIKNIIAQDIGEKENTREYNRNIIKQKNNSYFYCCHMCFDYS